MQGVWWKLRPGTSYCLSPLFRKTEKRRFEQYYGSRFRVQSVGNPNEKRHHKCKPCPSNQKLKGHPYIVPVALPTLLTKNSKGILALSKFPLWCP